MNSAKPAAPRRVVVIAGPNGAGKSTVAPLLLLAAEGEIEFVNADMIAGGLAAFTPEVAAIAAGRIMLARLHELAESGASFAFETTLSTRSFAPWIRRLKRASYDFHLDDVSLSTPALAVRRVAERTRLGGHSIPADVIRRRFSRSASNLFNLYMPIADRWLVLDNSGSTMREVASGGGGLPATIRFAASWRKLRHAAIQA